MQQKEKESIKEIHKPLHQNTCKLFPLHIKKEKYKKNQSIHKKKEKTKEQNEEAPIEKCTQEKIMKNMIGTSTTR